jgi:NHL repeat
MLITNLLYPEYVALYRTTTPPFLSKLLVTDRGYNRVVIIRNEPPISSGGMGTFGSENGQFNYPAGIAVDPSNGNIFVIDLGNNRVQKFAKDTQFINTWGGYGIGNGQFNSPVAIALDPSSGNVFVSELGNFRIQRFKNDGTFITKWSLSSSVSGVYSFAIATEPNSSNIYVVDNDRFAIVKYSSDGQEIAKFGNLGQNPGEFNGPTGIAIDPNSGNLFVADSLNHRIQKFTSNGDFIEQ